MTDPVDLIPDEPIDPNDDDQDEESLPDIDGELPDVRTDPAEE